VRIIELGPGYIVLLLLSSLLSSSSSLLLFLVHNEVKTPGVEN